MKSISNSCEHKENHMLRKIMCSKLKHSLGKLICKKERNSLSESITFQAVLISSSSEI